MSQLVQEFQVTEADFQTVRDVVYKHCGISLGADKQALVRARLGKQARAGGFGSATEYLEHALADRSGRMFADFIDAISTNLTSFFREAQHFDYLSNTVLPAMLAERRQKGDGRILIWSAACSSGEEPYTLAMTILEAIAKLKPGTLRWDIRTLATDISTRMLATATKGVYDAARVSQVPAACRAKYFVEAPDSESGGHFAVTQELRNIVQFRHLNLIGAWPFKGPFDFIFCRNVMIYFDQMTQQGLVDRFWSCLRPGGYLFTGHSESLTGISHRFTNVKASIYRKAPDNLL